MEKSGGILRVDVIEAWPLILGLIIAKDVLDMSSMLFLGLSHIHRVLQIFFYFYGDHHLYCEGCIRYKVKLRVSDATGYVVFLLFDNDMNYLLNKQCSSLVSAAKVFFNAQNMFCFNLGDRLTILKKWAKPHNIAQSLSFVDLTSEKQLYRISSYIEDLDGNHKSLSFFNRTSHKQLYRVRFFFVNSFLFSFVFF